ncbi:PepSY domain-containing protein [uncultured Flavonifractor sp.]|uniref:PepSY domain-containing protein n=1 Tax=uncultured Flavonifractor sp. TaxID=1193534 RepID=UPI00262A01E0|nr:PepSY domain-containing protein [uncultured Flavonifractor sp.]
MNEREVEARLRTALEHAAPDDLNGVLTRCGAQSGDVIPLPKRRRPMRRAAPWLVAACLVLVLAGGVMGVRYQRASAVASLVSLDVNPSVLLEVSEAQKVLSAQPINDDAGNILDGMDLRGTDLNVAVNAIVGSLLKHGYVDELANSVLISVEDSDAARGAALEEKLTGEIAQVLESASIHGAILSQSFSGGDDALRQQAEAYGISMGKAALIQTLVDSSTHLSFESLAGLSINELNLLVNSTAVQDQPAQAGETVAEQSAITSTGSASQSGYIGLEAAQSAALAHAGLDAASVTWKEAGYDYEDGRMVYEMEFFANGVEYEYDVDASTGEILKMEKEGAEWTAPSGGQAGTQTGGGQSGVIGRDAARDTALSHGGVSLSQVYELEVEDELDEEYPHYKVEFKAGGYEYEYEIDAFTGSILKWEKDRDD